MGTIRRRSDYSDLKLSEIWNGLAGGGFRRDGSFERGLHLIRPVTGPLQSSSSSSSSEGSGGQLSSPVHRHYFKPGSAGMVHQQAAGGRFAPIDVEADRNSPLQEAKGESERQMEDEVGSGDTRPSGFSGDRKRASKPEPKSESEPSWERFEGWKVGRTGRWTQLGQKIKRLVTKVKSQSKQQKARIQKGQKSAEVEEPLPLTRPLPAPQPKPFGGIDESSFPSDDELLAITGVNSPSRRGFLYERVVLPAGATRLPSTQGRGELTSANGCWLGGSQHIRLTKVPLKWSIHDFKHGPYPGSDLYLQEAARGIGDKPERTGSGLASVCFGHIICLLRAFLIYGSELDEQRKQLGLESIRHRSYGNGVRRQALGT